MATHTHDSHIQAQHSIEQVDMINATSKLQLEAADVRSPQNKPNWTSYLRSQLVPQEEYNFITAYDNARSKAERDAVINRDRSMTARCIISLISDVAKDQLIRYVLTVFDDLLQEDKSRVEIFHDYARKMKRTIWSWFQGILTRNDNFIVNQISSIFAKLACSGSTLMEGKELIYYFSFLKDELKNPNNEYINTSARCLQMMLRIDEYRREFVKADGIATLMSALNGKANFQLQYQLIFCLWCLSFNCDIAIHIQNSGIIQTLGDILSECSKEKVIRIILATFHNLLEKIDDREIARVSALQMVQCKTLKTLELMDAKKFDDPDLQEDIEFLSEKLHTSVQDLSSFDEYCTEKMLKTPNYKVDDESVYPPSEDTFILLDALEKDYEKLSISKIEIVIEIGSGSGVVSTFLQQLLSMQSTRKMHTFFICTDLNERALKCTMKTAELNMIPAESFDTVNCDLTDPLLRRLANSVDVLLFNPPYVPSEEPAKCAEVHIVFQWLNDFYYAGGLNGREVIDKVLPKARMLLSPCGVFYLVALKANKVDEIMDQASKQHQLRSEIVLERRCGIEYLFVLKLWRIV